MTSYYEAVATFNERQDVRRIEAEYVTPTYFRLLFSVGTYTLTDEDGIRDSILEDYGWYADLDLSHLNHGIIEIRTAPFSSDHSPTKVFHMLNELAEYIWETGRDIED